MIPLRIRKVLYLCVAVPACAFWIPVSILGIAILVGIVGLLSIGSLLRCIGALPVTSRFARNYHTAAISVGLLLMSGFIALSIVEKASYISLIVSGVALLVVGAAVLVELHAQNA